MEGLVGILGEKGFELTQELCKTIEDNPQEPGVTVAALLLIANKFTKEVVSLRGIDPNVSKEQYIAIVGAMWSYEG